MQLPHARGEIDFDLDGTQEVVANAVDFNTFMTKVDTAIGRLNGYFNQLGLINDHYLVRK